MLFVLHILRPQQNTRVPVDSLYANTWYLHCSSLSHPTGCEVASPSVSDMYFHNDRWCWGWVHGLWGHWSLFLREWSVQIFHSLLKAWLASHFVIELLVFFTCLHRNKFYARHVQIFFSPWHVLALIKSSESLISYFLLFMLQTVIYFYFYMRF